MIKMIKITYKFIITFRAKYKIPIKINNYINVAAIK